MNAMFIRLFGIVALLQSGAVFCASPVWEVSKGKNTLYIGGTMHLLAEEDYPLPEAYETAYDKADMLVLETDPKGVESPSFIKKVQKLGQYEKGRDISSVLKPATLKLLVTHLKQSGFNVNNTLKLKPGMLAMQLTLYELQRLGLAGIGVDAYYHRMAMCDDKPIGQLETAEQQLVYLQELGKGQDDELVSHTINELNTIPSYIAELKSAWRRGDEKALDELTLDEVKRDYRNLYDAMIVARNALWLPQIENMFLTPKIELVLVGIAHLVGEHGLLPVLKSKGYTIRQLQK